VGDSIVRIACRPSVDIVLAAVESTEISLAMLGLRRARLSAGCSMLEDVMEVSLAMLNLRKARSSAVCSKAGDVMVVL